MTQAKAAGIRAEGIEGKRKSRKEIKAEQEAKKLAEKNKWIIHKLWIEYKAQKPNLKGLATDQSRYDIYIEPDLGSKEPKELAPLDIDRPRINLQKKKAPGTVKNMLELLRRIVNFGEKNISAMDFPSRSKCPR